MPYYFIHLYHKDSKELVIADDPPVKLYSQGSVHGNPQRALLGKCLWWVFAESSFYIMYNERVVCRWGGEMVIRQLPYERGQQSLM